MLLLQINHIVLFTNMNRRFFLVIVLLCSFFKTFAQSDTSFSEKDRYRKVHKRLRTIGWVSLGTGVVSSSLGLVALAASIETGEKENWLFVTGGTLIGASIPCFIFSHQYKNRAAMLSMGTQRVIMPEQKMISMHLKPAITITIPL